VFGRVVGRTNDFLRTASGALVSPAQAVEAADLGSTSVIDFQVVQGAGDRLRIFVVQRDSPNATSDRERLAATFHGLVQPPERPRIERVDHIALTPGGKLRTLVSER
jgi:hypothetical protein